MAYLHCHNCDWEQDDFWSKTYNPIHCLLDDESDLLNKDLSGDMRMDRNFMKEHGFVGKFVTVREYILFRIEQIKKRIIGMKYRTMEEYKKSNPERICPICKQQNLDID